MSNSGTSQGLEDSARLRGPRRRGGAEHRVPPERDTPGRKGRGPPGYLEPSAVWSPIRPPTGRTPCTRVLCSVGRRSEAQRASQAVTGLRSAWAPSRASGQDAGGVPSGRGSARASRPAQVTHAPPSRVSAGPSEREVPPWPPARSTDPCEAGNTAAQPAPGPADGAAPAAASAVRPPALGTHSPRPPPACRAAVIPSAWPPLPPAGTAPRHEPPPQYL